jgi:tetratricopeptide (TPR) repeat protein
MPQIHGRYWRQAIVAIAVLLGSGSSAIAQDSLTRAKQAYTRAIELESQGNSAAALSLLWEASGLAPRDPDIQNRLGEALERIGALDAAIEAYRRALAARPSFPKAENNLILALVKSGNGSEGLQRARALVVAAPKDPSAYFTLGLAQSDQDIDGAIASFRRVLELAPRHALARYNLALVLRRADRLADASAELARSIDIEPSAESHYLLGVIAWHQGDLDRAVDALTAAISAQPRYAEGYEALGAVLKARRDWKGSIAALRRAIELRPEAPAAHYTLAQVLQQSGDQAGARSHLDDAERLRQRTAAQHEALVWTAVGVQKREAGDLPGARTALDRAVSIDDGYAPAHYQRGLLLQRLGDPTAARAAFARAQQLNPSLIPPY